MAGEAWANVARLQVLAEAAREAASQAREYGEDENSPYFSAEVSAECALLVAIETATGC